jgi:hypothetical protein
VVQAADFWDLHDLASCGKLDRPVVGCVLVEREVGARLMVIGEVTGQDSAQVSVAQDENVVETLAADRTDQAFGERVGQSNRLHTLQTVLSEAFGSPIRSIP